MTLYIGVDFHARQQTISYLTTEEGEIRGLELDHGEPGKVRKFTSSLPEHKWWWVLRAVAMPPGSRNCSRNWVMKSGLGTPRRFAALLVDGRRTIGEMLI